MSLTAYLLQDSEPDIIDGVGTEAGHVIRTTIGGRNGQSRQVGKLFSELVIHKYCIGAIISGDYFTSSEIYMFFGLTDNKLYS